MVAATAETPVAAAARPPDEVLLISPVGIDTGYLDSAQGGLVFYWSNKSYWRFYLPIAEARALKAAVGPFDPKKPPRITRADVRQLMKVICGE